MEKKQNTLYMLIGVPGSGKSTWLDNQIWIKDIPIISTDRFIDAQAKLEGKTYNQVFHDYIKIATKLLENQVLIIQANNKDAIWDQTNVSVKTRKAKLEKFSGYRKIAVFFPTPEAEELKRRLDSRDGKYIPENVMKSMIKNLEMPTLEEGFDEVWTAA